MWWPWLSTPLSHKSQPPTAFPLIQGHGWDPSQDPISAVRVRNKMNDESSPDLAAFGGAFQSFECIPTTTPTMPINPHPSLLFGLAPLEQIHKAGSICSSSNNNSLSHPPYLFPVPLSSGTTLLLPLEAFICLCRFSVPHFSLDLKKGF